MLFEEEKKSLGVEGCIVGVKSGREEWLNSPKETPSCGGCKRSPRNPWTFSIGWSSWFVDQHERVLVFLGKFLQRDPSVDFFLRVCSQTPNVQTLQWFCQDCLLQHARAVVEALEGTRRE